MIFSIKRNGAADELHRFSCGDEYCFQLTAFQLQGVQHGQAKLRFLSRHGKAGVAGSEQKGFAVADEEHLPIVAVNITEFGSSTLPARAVQLWFAGGLRGLEKMLEIFPGVEPFRAAGALERRYDHRSSTGRRLDLEVVVGLSQSPEWRHRDTYIATRGRVDAFRMTGILRFG